MCHLCWFIHFDILYSAIRYRPTFSSVYSIQKSVKAIEFFPIRFIPFSLYIAVFLFYYCKNSNLKLNEKIHMLILHKLCIDISEPVVHWSLNEYYLNLHTVIVNFFIGKRGKNERRSWVLLETEYFRNNTN